MATPQSPQPPEPPKPPPDHRLITWAQRLNGEYASVVRWVALVGFVTFASLGRLEVAAAFGGLIPISLTIGKP